MDAMRYGVVLRLSVDSAFSSRFAQLEVRVPPEFRVGCSSAFHLIAALTRDFFNIVEGNRERPWPWLDLQVDLVA
jgi:hypothetical protein